MWWSLLFGSVARTFVAPALILMLAGCSPTSEAEEKILELEPQLEKLLAGSVEGRMDPAFARAIGIDADDSLRIKSCIQKKWTATNRITMINHPDEPILVVREEGTSARIFVTGIWGRLDRAYLLEDENLANLVQLKNDEVSEEFEAEKAFWVEWKP